MKRTKHGKDLPRESGFAENPIAYSDAGEEPKESRTIACAEMSYGVNFIFAFSHLGKV